MHLSGRPQKKWAKITPLSPISSSPHIPQRVVRAVGRPAAGQTCLHRVSLYRVNTSDLQNIYPDVPVLSFFPLLRVFFLPFCKASSLKGVGSNPGQVVIVTAAQPEP